MRYVRMIMISYNGTALQNCYDLGDNDTIVEYQV